MGNNHTVNVGIDVTAPGLKAINKEAGQLHSSLKGAAEEGVKIRVPSATAAARQGVAASSSPVLKAGTPSGTNLSRGIAGATGAEGRDFAKQAQGLGGLVHVYATFAANLFAVSAAFGALKQAADTTNMVKGLDQLGAASGVALGSLSKRLVQATEGAISLREAMEATAKASSSGMSSAQIIRMGDAAKKASQALGVDMSDAVSRLSRGITKLEPELLDELGIFVRIDDVVKNYAQSVGKAASSLTDFERRQAFANAVLDQAERKFSAINIDSNPYAKLLASMKDVAQGGLELINKVLGPIVRLISESPTGLAVAMGGIATMLLKQAIPALGAFRENAKLAAEQATNLANKRNTEAAAAGVEGAKRGLTAESQARIALLRKRIEQENNLLSKAANQREIEAEAFANKALSNLGGKIGKRTTDLLRKPVEDLSPKDLSLVDKNIERAKLAVSKADTESNRQRLKDYESVKLSIYETIKADKLYSDTVLINKAKIADAEKKVAAEEATRQKIKANYWSVEAAAQRTADAANKAAVSRNIVANAGELTRIEGIRAAYTKLNKDIAAAKQGSSIGEVKIPPFGALIAGFTRVKGAISIATTAVEVFSTTINRAFMVVGALTLVFGIFDSVFSKNSKQVDKFTEGLIASEEAVDGLERTLESISSKDPFGSFSVTNIQARATAIKELSDSLLGLSSSFIKAMENASWWDRGLDNFKDAIGLGLADKLSSSLSRSISQGLQGIKTGPLREKAAKELQEILGKGIDPTNIKQVDAALRSLNNEDIAAATAKISKLFAEVSTGANNSASNLVSAKAKIDELSKVVQIQAQKLVPTADISKLGMSMMDAGEGLTKALESPVESMTLLNSLIKDTRLMSILNPDTSNMLINASDEIKNVTASYSQLQSSILKAEADLQKLKNDGKAESTSRKRDGSGVATFDTAAGAEAKQIIANLKTEIAQAEVKMKTLGAQVTAKIAADFVNVGLKNLATGLNTAMAEGGITAAKGYLSVLKSVGVETADAETKVREQEIAAQRQTLEATYLQIKSQQQLTNTNDRLALEIKELALSMDLNSTSEARRAQAAGSDRGTNLAKERKTLEDRVKITNMSPSEMAKFANNSGSTGIFNESTQSMSAFIASTMELKAGQSRLGGQSSANQVQGMANKIKEQTQVEKDSLDAKIKVNNVLIEQKNNLQEISLEFNKVLQQERDELVLKNLSLASDKEAKDIASSLKILDNLKGRGDEDKRKESVKRFEKAEVDRKFKLEQDTASEKTKQLTTLQSKQNEADDKALSAIRTRQAANDTLDTAKINSQEIELEYLKSIDGISAKQIAIDTLSLASQKESMSVTKDLLEIEDARFKKVREFEQAKDRGADKAKTDVQIAETNAIAALNRQARELAYTTAIKGIVRKTTSERIKSEQELAGILRERTNIERNELSDIGQAKLDQKQQELEYLTTIGFLNASDSTRQIVSIALQQQELSFQRESLAIESKRAQEKERLNSTLTTQKKERAGPEQIAQTEASLKFAEESYARQKTLLDINNAARKEAITLTAEHNALMQEMENITKSLTDIFGDLGTAIGDTGKALLKMSQDEERFAKDKISLQKKLSSAASPSDADEIIKEQQALDKRSTASQISNIASVAGASKKMFAEKSNGYKLISGIEKAANAASLANSIATTAAKISADIPAVFVSFMKWLGPFGMAAAGIALASVVGGSGGSSVPSAPPVDAADRQSTQGTGQSWVDGAKVENGQGVFGDAEGKSNSIKNSLELIAATSVEGITYDNEMVALLTSIDKNIGSAAKGLYQIPGLRTGSAFGTVEKSTASPGFLGAFASSSSTEILDSGLQITGTFKELARQGKGVVKLFETVSKTKTNSGLFGLFSSNKTTVNTTFADIPREQVEEFGKIFGSMADMFVLQGEKLGVGGDSIEAALASIPVSMIASLRGLKGEELEKELSSILSSIADTTASKLFPQLKKYREFGEGMAETVSRVLDSQDKVKQAFESIGKPLTTLTETLGVASTDLLESVTTAQKAYDDAKAKIDAFVPQTVVTTSFGGREGGDNVSISETLPDPKLVQDLTAATRALESAQSALLEVTTNSTTKNLDVIQALVNGMGSLENLISATKKFGDAFMTDSERLAPRVAALNTQMDKLGSATVYAQEMFTTFSDGGDGIINTREEFKRLVLGINATTDAGISLLTGLYKVQDSFDLVRSAEEALAKAAAEIDLSILKESGQTHKALLVERAAELALLDPTLRAKKQELYSIQDANKTRDLLINLLNAEGRSNEALNATRLRSLAGMGLVDKSIAMSIHRAEDANKTRNLTIALLNAEGKSNEALNITRAQSLLGLSEQDAGIVRATHVAEDTNKTRDLTITLLNTEGNSLEALTLTRQKEIKSLSIVDASIQRRINAAIDENKTSAITVKLLQAQHKETEALTITRGNEAKALSQVDLAITRQIWAIEDAENAADKALAILGKSIDTQKNEIQDSIDILEPMASFLEEIFETLKDSIAELYATVDSTVKMTIFSANALIDSYIKTGKLPTNKEDVKSLTDAIGIAVKSTDNNNFATLQEANFAKLVLASKLTALETASEDQGTTADKQLKAAKDQLKALDDIYQKAKDQVDEFKGVNIAVMSVKDAIDNLAKVLSEGRANIATADAARITAVDASKIGPVTTPTVYSGLGTASSALQKAQEEGVAKIKRTVEDVYTLSKATNNYSPFLGVLKQFGFTSATAQSTFGMSDAATQSLITFAETQGIKGFASGGDHVGGLRLVGEDGPEVEATGPSRIFNANQTRSMLQPDNSELIAEIRLLRKEVQDLKAVNAAASEYNKVTSKQLTRWDVDGMPPERA